jgi:hypothetical protein
MDVVPRAKKKSLSIGRTPTALKSQVSRGAATRRPGYVKQFLKVSGHKKAVGSERASGVNV